ncbi:MAG TPA: hypothetical protein VGA21_02830 [Cyclobacteriaceae bacterium]|jgi:hypothetical protein
MKRKSIIIVLVSLLFACKNEELTELDKNTKVITENAQIGKGNVYTYTIGTSIPTEGDAIISKQANYFDVSEITTGASGVIYQYKPKPDFLGKDNVELIQTFSSGGAVFGRNIIKISITVATD